MTMVDVDGALSKRSEIDSSSARTIVSKTSL